MKVRLLAAGAIAALAIGACASSSSKTAAPTPKATTAKAAHDMGAMNQDHAGGSPDAAKGRDVGVADLGLGMLHNGHHTAMKYQKLDAATQAKVDALVAVSRGVAKKFPTLADAIKVGYTRAGPYSPGLGIHYIKFWGPNSMTPNGIVTPETMAEPLSILYDGTAPTAKIAGFMYYAATATTPEGFPGSNDFWHFHTNVCQKPAADGSDSPLGADKSGDPVACKKAGGYTMAKTQYMVHVWSVPGYEVSEADGGIFAEVNRALKCRDGSYFMMASKDWAAHPKNVCKSELKTA